MNQLIKLNLFLLEDMEQVLGMLWLRSAIYSNQKIAFNYTSRTKQLLYN